MNNFKGYENFMTLENRQANTDFERAYREVIKVYRFFDTHSQTNHCRILDALYNVKDQRFTLDGLATRMSISDNALRRYRRKYVDWFVYFLKCESKNLAA